MKLKFIYENAYNCTIGKSEPVFKNPQKKLKEFIQIRMLNFGGLIFFLIAIPAGIIIYSLPLFYVPIFYVTIIFLSLFAELFVGSTIKGIETGIKEIEKGKG
ncbi:MAG: hypothetical protein L6265_10120 [Thermoplasmatales archaeon]|nr:hypothetical protein [Candidatus Thermoplasmatota archaeon]MCG2826933.1 hypothetical protein [Thermoplasmatales archaeon]